MAPLFAEVLERAAVNTTIAPESRPADPDMKAARPSGAAPGQQPSIPSAGADARAIAWLEQYVEFGDVIYDVPAGVGEFVVTAVKRRAATVVAFEPGYRAYAALCDNVLQSGCEAWVVPVPLPLAGRDGLAEIKYEFGESGHCSSSVVQYRHGGGPDRPGAP